MRGGYKILDLTGTAFTSGSEVVIAGAYDLIESSHKAILVEGLDLDGSERKPAYVDFVVAASDYEGKFADGVTIKVTQSDGVTVTAAE